MRLPSGVHTGVCFQRLLEGEMQSSPVSEFVNPDVAVARTRIGDRYGHPSAIGRKAGPNAETFLARAGLLPCPSDPTTPAVSRRRRNRSGRSSVPLWDAENTARPSSGRREGRPRPAGQDHQWPAGSARQPVEPAMYRSVQRSVSRWHTGRVRVAFDHVVDPTRIERAHRGSPSDLLWSAARLYREIDARRGETPASDGSTHDAPRSDWSPNGVSLRPTEMRSKPPLRPGAKTMVPSRFQVPPAP